MKPPIESFPEAHRVLLMIFEETRKISISAAKPIVLDQLQALRYQLAACEDDATFTALANYLRYYAKKFSDPSILNILGIYNLTKPEAILSQDPSRYDQLLVLARRCINENNHNDARRMLQKIASSKFNEAKEAQRLLEFLLDGLLR